MMETGIRRENRKEFVDEIAAFLFYRDILTICQIESVLVIMEKVNFTDPHTNDVSRVLWLKKRQHLMEHDIF